MVSVGNELMALEASDDLRELIAERGGRLYVWATAHGCCSGRFWLLNADTERPSDPRLVFNPTRARGFDLYLDLAGLRPPEKLTLEAKGRHHKIKAYWNDLAWVA
jgi:hypothetical protein